MLGAKRRKEEERASDRVSRPGGEDRAWRSTADRRVQKPHRRTADPSGRVPFSLLMPFDVCIEFTEDGGGHQD